MKRQIRFITMLLSVVLLLQGAALASGGTGTVTYTSNDIEFLSNCDTYNEMEAKADLIVYGTVIDQWTEVRCNRLVLTISKLQIDTSYAGTETAQTINILQTGGETAELRTPVPGNAPLLEEGQPYYLYLKYAPADEMYDAYYLVIGGHQGAYEQAEINLARSSAAVPWNTLSTRAADRFGMEAVGYADPSDYLLGGSWETGSASYYIQTPNNLSTPENALLAQIADDAFQEWNVTDCKFRFYRTYSYINDIVVAFDFYGSLDWENYDSKGIAEGYTDHKGRQHIFYELVEVYANLTDYTLYNTDWASVLCHEAGHALGLAHNNDIAGSIMQESSRERGRVPSDCDIEAMIYIYGAQEEVTLE